MKGILEKVKEQGKYIVDLYNKIQNIETTIDSRPYKVYAALLTQSGTNAPTATVLKNTIGDIVWGYSSAGVYTASSGGAFTLNKTTMFIQSIFPNRQFSWTDHSLSELTLSSSSPQNGFTNLPIEIKIYY